jgi:hypothetical protein
MQIKKFWIYACGIFLICALFGMAAIAGGPPLKDKVCGTCHKDLNAIMPKDHPNVGKGEPCLSCHKPDPAKSEPTKFSTQIHKLHQEGKTKLECAQCHAL